MLVIINVVIIIVGFGLVIKDIFDVVGQIVDVVQKNFNVYGFIKFSQVLVDSFCFVGEVIGINLFVGIIVLVDLVIELQVFKGN